MENQMVQFCSILQSISMGQEATDTRLTYIRNTLGRVVSDLWLRESALIK